MSEKFYVDECPNESQLFDWICANSNWAEAVADVASQANNAAHLFMRYEWSNDALEKSAREAIERFGLRGWTSTSGVTDSYLGLSLMFNPNHIECTEPNFSTLGSVQTSHGTWGDHNHMSSGKNTYHDTLGFVQRTDPSHVSEIGRLLDSVEQSGFTNVRGRLAVIDGTRGIIRMKYHRDETVFENLRLNIPVFGYSDAYTYGFELEGYYPYPFEFGKAYTWDTNIPHSPMQFKMATEPRANLVLGISPWLRYLPEERAWVFNKHFGKTHPFNLLTAGVITSAVSLINAY